MGLFSCGPGGQLGERAWIGYRQLGKNLAVQANIGLLQSMNELAVGKIVHTGGSIDSGDPKLSEIPFPRFSVPECIHQCLVDRVCRCTKYFTAAGHKPFGQF